MPRASTGKLFTVNYLHVITPRSEEKFMPTPEELLSEEDQVLLKRRIFAPEAQLATAHRNAQHGGRRETTRF